MHTGVLIIVYTSRADLCDGGKGCSVQSKGVVSGVSAGRTFCLPLCVCFLSAELRHSSICNANFQGTPSVPVPASKTTLSFLGHL